MTPPAFMHERLNNRGDDGHQWAEGMWCGKQKAESRSERALCLVYLTGAGIAKGQEETAVGSFFAQ